MFWGIRNIIGAAVAVCVVMASAVGCGAQNTDEQKSAAVKPSPYEQKLDLLNQTADELYKLSEAGSFAEARLKLIQFGDLMNSVPFQGITSVEGAHALSESVVQAMRIFNAVKLSPDQALKASVKIRLAADAVSHKNQPMWLQYYKALKDGAQKLEQAAAARKALEAQQAFAAFKERYGTIRAAVWISREAWEGEKLDSLLVFLDNQLQAKDVSFENVMSGVKQLQDALDALFRKKDDRTAYIPVTDPGNPIQWSLTIGSLIIAVLSYVAWRMFQGDRIFSRVPRK